MIREAPVRTCDVSAAAPAANQPPHQPPTFTLPYLICGVLNKAKEQVLVAVPPPRHLPLLFLAPLPLPPTSTLVTQLLTSSPLLLPHNNHCFFCSSSPPLPAIIYIPLLHFALVGTYFPGQDSLLNCQSSSSEFSFQLEASALGRRTHLHTHKAEGEKIMENDLLIYSDLLFDNLDELLDFSKEEEAQMLSSAAETDMVTVTPPAWNKDEEDLLPCVPTTPKDITGASEDAFLCDDLDVAEMEWLSNFVEESFSPSGVDVSNATNNCITVGSNCNSNGIGIGSSNDNNVFYHHPMSVESNQDDELLYLANSPLSVLENNGILINNNSSGISSSPYSSSLSSPTSSSCSAVVSDLKPTERGRAPRTKRTRPLSFPHIIADPVLPTSIDTYYSAEEPVQKKKKLKIKFSQPPNALHTTAITNNEGGDVRKCLHCGIQKTPQWRLGPMGPKTLCNACGVRYKSGRLFPEYRPAASPTFVASVHSNSHKKVVEMRMTKTSTEEQEGAAVAAKQVSSKCCELLNYIRGSQEWGAHEGRKDRGVAV